MKPKMSLINDGEIDVGLLAKRIDRFVQHGAIVEAITSGKKMISSEEIQKNALAMMHISEIVFNRVMNEINGEKENADENI